MESLIDNTLFGQLIVELLLSWDLELSVQFLALIVMVLVMVIIVTVATSASD